VLGELPLGLFYLGVVVIITIKTWENFLNSDRLKLKRVKTKIVCDVKDWRIKLTSLAGAVSFTTYYLYFIRVTMISVIIPCFNSEEYITRAIESVLRQTFTDYEIILVNNNSTDNTNNILEDYAKKFPDRIRVFNEYKKGAPSARNKGLYEAKGEWIQFLDSDDELFPDKFEKQLATAVASEDIIIGDYYMYKKFKNKTRVTIPEVEVKNVWKGLITSKLGVTSANLWRKKALLAVGGWNEEKSSSQEYDLIFRLLKNNSKVTYCALPLTNIYIRPDSIHASSDDNKFVKILENNINLRLEIKKYLQSGNMLTKELNLIVDTYIHTLLITKTGFYPFTLKKGILAEYVKKKYKESNLNLPLSFIMRFYTRRMINLLKERIA
jgi:glycosyltransferase involved in cell wall biosynthesis